MRIKEITRQHRRDFWAVFECERCGHEFERSGYDDKNFHENVIPSWPCPECGEKAPDNYRPMATKYRAWEVV